MVGVGANTVVQWRMLEPEQIGQGTAVTQHWALGNKEGKESVGVNDVGAQVWWEKQETGYKTEGRDLTYI